MNGLAVLLGLWGVIVGILWLLIGFRAVRAHEELAKAQSDQTNVIKDYLKDLSTQRYLDSKREEARELVK